MSGSVTNRIAFTKAAPNSSRVRVLAARKAVVIFNQQLSIGEYSGQYDCSHNTRTAHSSNFN